jgi:hypothetical protein
MTLNRVTLRRDQNNSQEGNKTNNKARARGQTVFVSSPSRRRSLRNATGAFRPGPKRPWPESTTGREVVLSHAERGQGLRLSCLAPKANRAKQNSPPALPPPGIQLFRRFGPALAWEAVAECVATQVRQVSGGGVVNQVSQACRCAKKTSKAQSQGRRRHRLCGRPFRNRCGAGSRSALEVGPGVLMVRRFS